MKKWIFLFAFLWVSIMTAYVSPLEKDKKPYEKLCTLITQDGEIIVGAGNTCECAAYPGCRVHECIYN